MIHHHCFSNLGWRDRVISDIYLHKVTDRVLINDDAFTGISCKKNSRWQRILGFTWFLSVVHDQPSLRSLVLRERVTYVPGPRESERERERERDFQPEVCSVASGNRLVLTDEASKVVWWWICESASLKSSIQVLVGHVYLNSSIHSVCKSFAWLITHSPS